MLCTILRKKKIRQDFNLKKLWLLKAWNITINQHIRYTLYVGYRSLFLLRNNSFVFKNYSQSNLISTCTQVYSPSDKKNNCITYHGRIPFPFPEGSSRSTAYHLLMVKRNLTSSTPGDIAQEEEVAGAPIWLLSGEGRKIINQLFFLKKDRFQEGKSSWISWCYFSHWCCQGVMKLPILQASWNGVNPSEIICRVIFKKHHLKVSEKWCLLLPSLEPPESPLGFLQDTY